MDEIDIQRQKAIISERMRTQSFLSVIVELTPTEKEVLRVLIVSGSALPIKTIRSAIITHIVQRHKKELLAHVPETALEDPFASFASLMAKSQTLFASAKSQTPRIVPNPIQQPTIYIAASLVPDELALERGITPFSSTKKVSIWEHAVRQYLPNAEIPNWAAIKNAVASLQKETGFVEKRPTPGKKAKLSYYASPILYALWEQQNEKVRKIPKAERNAAQKFWFS